jgi:hypothetical protein
MSVKKFLEALPEVVPKSNLKLTAESHKAKAKAIINPYLWNEDLLDEESPC